MKVFVHHRGKFIASEKKSSDFAFVYFLKKALERAAERKKNHLKKLETCPFLRGSVEALGKKKNCSGMLAGDKTQIQTRGELKEICRCVQKEKKSSFSVERKMLYEKRDLRRIRGKLKSLQRALRCCA